ADVKSFSVGRNAYSVGVIEVGYDLHPLLTARRKIKNFPDNKRRYGWIGVWAKNCGISTTVSGHDNIVDAADKLLAVAIGIPPAQLLPGHVEFQDRPGITSAGEQERFLFRECQAVVAAAFCVIQHSSRCTIPLGQRI